MECKYPQELSKCTKNFSTNFPKDVKVSEDKIMDVSCISSLTCLPDVHSQDIPSRHSPMEFKYPHELSEDTKNLSTNSPEVLKASKDMIMNASCISSLTCPSDVHSQDNPSGHLPVEFKYPQELSADTKNFSTSSAKVVELSKDMFLDASCISSLTCPFNVHNQDLGSRHSPMEFKYPHELSEDTKNFSTNCPKDIKVSEDMVMTAGCISSLTSSSEVHGQDLASRHSSMEYTYRQELSEDTENFSTNCSKDVKVSKDIIMNASCISSLTCLSDVNGDKKPGANNTENVEIKGTYPPPMGMVRSSEDGYNWRKYGQKQVKGSEYPRSYYKCTHPNCQVKKKVERSHDGQITEIIYKGGHSHSKPQPSRQSSSLFSNDMSDISEGNGPYVNIEGAPIWRNIQPGPKYWKGESLEGTSSTSMATELSDPLSTKRKRSSMGVIGLPESPDFSSTVASHEDDDDGTILGRTSLGGDAGDDDESESKRRYLLSSKLPSFNHNKYLKQINN